MGDSTWKPAARTSGLVIKAVGDEVLVYDLETHRAHCVNRIAAAVWRRCNGTQDAAAIAATLQREGTVPTTEEAVRYALGELGRARLLAGPMAAARLTRRDLIRRLGTAAAVALPAVTTIIAPTAAQAQSCVGADGPCTSDAQCCSNTCLPGINGRPGACIGSCVGMGGPCTSDAQCCSDTCLPGINGHPGACIGS